MAASQRLTRALNQRLGDELSRELLTWMGQMDSSRSELAELHSEFLKFVIQTNRRFDGVEARLGSLESKFDKLESKIDGIEGRMTAFFARQYGDLLKWSFVFWCGSVFAIAGLVIAALK